MLIKVVVEAFDKSVIEQLEQLVQDELRPDCTIILDAPIEVGFARANARAELDRMESEPATFHQAVRDSYLVRAKQHPEKYAVVNADQPLAVVQQAIQLHLDRLITQWQA